MNLALTGANGIVVVPGVADPCAMGALHVAPSADTCTWYARGNVDTAGVPPRPPIDEDVN